ncbi:MAG: hypothetical protein EZS26_000312 [Candidatus Ordinivivax streblomastigis]|uniref:F5/8 type C domain-containing protein n=1 Tax=Candidatus Ordinivivax streblomastigis TaxID=2540710 RepID=A0A5M8P5Q4_9BACT|nr:MAG: hypothetical protein EZS26_000312 [Candidatus Ordinivivax streblomastigis]
MRKVYLLIMVLMLMCIVAPSMFADAVYNDIDRTDWTVTTSTDTGYGYVPDGTTGKPQDMFDGTGATFLSLVKPGKSYGTVPAQSAEFIPSFTVDLGTSQSFNYIKWQHRSGNQYNYLRVWGVDVAGSNDGLNFTTIVSELEIPTNDRVAHAQDPNPYYIDIPASSYKYVRVTLTKWSDNSGGAASGSTMQIGEFGLGNTSTDIVIYQPADLTFGDILQGANSTKTLTVTGANLSSAITYTKGDEADAAAFTITPGAWTSTGGTAEIKFAPTAKKLYDATLILNSDGALETQTIHLIGNADFDLPVQISSKNTTDEHWYYIQFARQATAGKVLTVVDPTIEGDTIRQLPLDVTNASQLWKVTGTWDNYTVENKSNNRALVYAYAPVGEDPATGEPTPEINRYVTEEADLADQFGFVRYGTTDTWQLKNVSNYTDAPATKLYVNDLTGASVTGYSVNNAGNQLRFIDADIAQIIVAADTVKLGSVKSGTSDTLKVIVAGLKLTSDITIVLSNDADGVYTLNTTSLPATGGDVEVTFAPTAYKKISYATLTLTSGSIVKTVVVSTTSDTGVSKYYVGTTWGARNDGEIVETIPTTLKANDVIWIAEGEYTTAQITLQNGVQIYGGFAGTEQNPNERAVGVKPWEFTHPSVLKNSAALVASSAASNDLIDGVTFEGTSVIGRAFQSTAGEGHIIRNSVLKNFNSGASDGGAFNIRAGAEIYNCLITGNAGVKGGGGYFEGGSIHDCEITNNSVTLKLTTSPGGSADNTKGCGGGLFLSTEKGGAKAYNLYVSGNTASFGGGIYSRSNTKLYNSVIVNNTADESGSGVAFEKRDAGAQVYNVTIANNRSNQRRGAGVLFSGENQVQHLYNSILWNNTDGYEDIYNISGYESATPVIKNVIIDDLEYYAEVDPNLAITNGIAVEDSTLLFTANWVTADASPGKEAGLILLSEAIVDVDPETDLETVIPATYLEFATGKDFAGNQRIAGTIDIGPYEDQSNVAINNVKPEIVGNVIATKYYNIQGIEVSRPTTTGVYIQKEWLDTNKIRVTKFLNIQK